MKTKYYVNDSGEYVGAFSGALPSVGAVEVPEPPEHARDLWNGESWESVTEKVQKVDMAQARLALLSAGHLSAVEGIINAMPEPQQSAARVEWEYRQIVSRDSQLTQVIASSLNLSESDMDALFFEASIL